ncbi:MAG TPA: universal stress protein [Candidatus Rifleibacterium sp.]|mgnify:FL=1|nr:universal stress protein [Candidatus Rifleibacterium sp.]HQB82708.1 universal stress protein [Candidatus Rifleibacterium sp.]
MIKINKILVPIDFSEGSELALRYAATFASEYGAQIHLLNVIEEEVLHAGNLSDPLETSTKWQEQNMKQLESFVPAKYNDFDIIRKVQGGLVYETIINYAKENEISLIIIGAHGKTGFIDSWLGGNSYEIARKSPCAVLTVKPRGRGFVERTA